MCLWRSIVGAANVPCVDGDFDDTVIGHELTPPEPISKRMIGGPDCGLSGYQASGMGKSWLNLAV